MIVLAIDLGGSHATCAALIDGEIRASLVVSHDGGTLRGTFVTVLNEIASCLHSICRELHIQSRNADGLVFGFPGVVNAAGTQVIATNEKYEEACEVNFGDWAHRQLGIRCVLENDARLALMGEHDRGAAQGFEDAALVTLGTGIGAAAMLKGRVLRGVSGMAGCLGGHLPIKLGGRRCTCGNVGCAEAEGSTWALKQIAQEIPGYTQSQLSLLSVLDFKTIFTLADAGDSVAIAVLDHCIQAWSALAVAIYHAYSPQVLLFGGGVMARADDILPAVCRHVEAHAWHADDLVVRAAALGTHAALYGAIPRLHEALS